MDPIVNFAYGIVATAPGPPTTGQSLVLQAGQGASFPQAATPQAFDVLMWPAGVTPLNSNAEIARCTSVSGDTLIIPYRAQYGTTPQPVAAGYQVCQPIDANLLNQLVTPILPFHVEAGRFMSVPQLFTTVTGSPSALTNGQLGAFWFSLTKQVTLTSIGIGLWSNGGAGSVIRLGLYNDSNGYPGSLILDAGTVVTSSGATARISTTISQVLNPGTYWAAMVAQGSPSPNPTILQTNGIGGPVNAGSVPHCYAGWSLTGVTGALPDPFTAGGSAFGEEDSNGCFRIYLGA